MKRFRKSLALLLVISMLFGNVSSASVVGNGTVDTGMQVETTAEGTAEESTSTETTTEATEETTTSSEMVTTQMSTVTEEDTTAVSTQQEEATTEETVPSGGTDNEAVSVASTATKPEDGTNKEQPFPTNIGVGHYRIPALQTLSDGTLVAAADARWGAWQTPDDCANIDSIVSKSTDNGTNWNYTFANYIADNSNTRDFAAATFIDPALATDGETLYMVTDLFPGQNESKNCSVAAKTGTGFDSNGNLLLKEKASATSFDYYLKDGAVYKVSDNSKVAGYSVDAYFNLSKDGKELGNLFTYSTSYYQPLMTSYLYFTTSTDGGATWSEPTLLNVKNATENYYLVCPGRGMVASDGAIVFPCYTKSTGSDFTMSLLYSTDNGISWKRSTSNTSFDASEGNLVELADGTLRYFYRHNYKNTSQLQYVDITGNGTNGYTFGQAVTVSGVTVYSGCNLSAMVYSKTIDGKQVILVSCPTSSRTTGKIFTFTVETDKSLKLQATYDVNGNSDYSYSCLTEQKDGSIGLLYEKGDKGSITYTNLSVEKVASGVTFDTEDNPDADNGNDGSDEPSNGGVNSAPPYGDNTNDSNSNGTANETQPEAETVNVELYVGEEKTFTIDGYVYGSKDSDWDTRYVDVTLVDETISANKELKSVTEIESGKSYLIVNNSTNTLLTSTSGSTNGWNKVTGLKLSGDPSVDSTELWTIKENGENYSVQNRAEQYLTISNNSARVSSSYNSDIKLTYTSGSWMISKDVTTTNWNGTTTTYYLNRSNNLAIGSSSSSTSSSDNYKWTIYEVVDIPASSNTKVTIKGVGQTDETEVIVGHVTYKVTVKPAPELVTIETTPFLGGKGQGDGQKLTGLVITAGTEYQINLADGKTATSWTMEDTAVATVSNGKVTGKKEGETKLTAIDGVEYSIPVTVLAGPTTTSKRIIDAYSAQVKNCTPYYSINSGELIEFKEGTQIYTEYNSDATRLITFFATPKEGYALTLVGDKTGDYFHSVRNEDGTGYGYDGTHNDGNTTIPSDGKGYTYIHDQLIVYVVNNTGSKAATADQVHGMLDRAVELKCDGAYFYSRGVGKDGSNNAKNIESYAAFIAEPLPTVEKKVSKVNGKTYVEGETKINVGDTITFDVDVTQYAPEGDYTKVQNANNPASADITYTNASLNDKLENATFKNGTSTTTPELSNTAVSKNTTITYEVTYKVTEDDLDTKIVNTVDLTYSYQSKHSRGTSKRSANAEASVSVLKGTPDNIVIDFGLPVTVNCSEITSYDFTKGTARFGIVDVSGTTATYTPNTVLTDVDIVTLTNTQGAEYKFKVYPATTVYYEEGFASKLDGCEWTELGKKAAEGSKQKWTIAKNAGEDYYGYDASYESNNLTEAYSKKNGNTSAIGNAETFTFTGTGVDIYANCTKNTGMVLVQIIDTETNVTEKMMMVDTAMKLGKIDSACGLDNLEKVYNVPIVSITDGLTYGKYQVIIRHVKFSGTDETDDGIIIDGFRIYNTLAQNEDASEVYKEDNEQTPQYTELRDKVLSSLGAISSDSAQYADQIASNTYSQVYSKTDNTNGAVVLSAESAGYTATNLEDFIDNCSKNELYLYPQQSLTFKVSAENVRTLRIGLRALGSEVKYTINDGQEKVMKAKTDMYYPISTTTDESGNILCTITNISEKGSNSILSITKLKNTGISAAQKALEFMPLTADDLVPALLSLGYQAAPVPDTGNKDNQTTPDKDNADKENTTSGTIEQPGNTTETPGTTEQPEDTTQIPNTDKGETDISKKKATLTIHYVTGKGQKVAQATATAEGEEGKSITYTAKQVKQLAKSNLPKGYVLRLLNKYKNVQVKYGDSASVTVKVVKAFVPKKASVKKAVSTKKKQMKVTWKKVNKASGYKVFYSTDQDFRKNVKTVTVKGNKTFSKTIKGLKAGKTYYVRVKAYTKTEGQSVYGSFSKVQKVKIKK